MTEQLTTFTSASARSTSLPGALSRRLWRPETLVVAADGGIAYRHIGAITDQALAETMLPLIQHLRTGNKEGG